MFNFLSVLRKQSGFLFGFLSFLLAFFFQGEVRAEDVKTVPQVDLNRYLGDWYEIASIPQFFQRACVKNTKANYQLDPEGLVIVRNQCDQEDGSSKTAEGRARIEDRMTNSKLTVTFVKIFGSWIFAFGGAYWIIQLEPDYRYAVVGHPSLKYGWILSRSPALSNEVVQGIEQQLRSVGYDTCKWMMSVQDNGNSQKVPLCEWVKEKMEVRPIKESSEAEPAKNEGDSGETLPTAH